MGKGEEEAVAVLRNVARVNGKEGSAKLMADDLVRMANGNESGLGERMMKECGGWGGDLREVVLKKVGVGDASHVKPFFATRKLAWSIALLIFIVLWDQSFI